MRLLAAARGEPESRSAPIGPPGDFARAIGILGPPHPWALAVSGGPDSTALMVVAAAHCRANGLPLPIVMTVDHALRPESAAEMAGVAAAAERLGLRHLGLTWACTKPGAGLQAAARRARYGLLAGACADAGIASLMTGHTLDDQIETAAMRAAKGSGDLGMACMPSQSLVPGTRLRLVRPFLATRKADIEAYLNARCIAYVVDPSNRDFRFDRGRLRQSALGAHWPAAIARAGVARIAIERRVAAFMDAEVAVQEDGAVSVRRAPLAASDAALCDAVLGAVLRRVGGRDHPARRRQKAALADAIRGAGVFEKRTLGGCIVRPVSRAEMNRLGAALVFEPENRAIPRRNEWWLPFAVFPQMGPDGALLARPR